MQRPISPRDTTPLSSTTHLPYGNDINSHATGYVTHVHRPDTAPYNAKANANTKDQNTVDELGNEQEKNLFQEITALENSIEDTPCDSEYAAIANTVNNFITGLTDEIYLPNGTLLAAPDNSTNAEGKLTRIFNLFLAIAEKIKSDDPYDIPQTNANFRKALTLVIPAYLHGQLVEAISQHTKRDEISEMCRTLIDSYVGEFGPPMSILGAISHDFSTLNKLPKAGQDNEPRHVVIDLGVDESFHMSAGKQGFCSDLCHTIFSSISFVTNNKATSDWGRYACNFANIITRMTASVGLPTLVRELMLEHITVKPQAAEYLALASLSYSVGLNILGLVGDRCCGIKMDEAVNEFCREMEGKIQTYFDKNDVQIDQEQLKHFFANVRGKNISFVEEEGMIDNETYQNYFKEANEEFDSLFPKDDINVFFEQEHDNIPTLLTRLEQKLQGKYWDTKATTAVRLLNILSLVGIGYGSWHMGLWPKFGLTLATYNTYCFNRDILQLFLRLEENINKFYAAPTIISGASYSVEQTGLSLAMNAVTNNVSNPLVRSAGKTLINTVGETWDYARVCGLHTHYTNESLKVRLSFAAPTKEELFKIFTGVGTERPVLFDLAVMVPDLAKAVAANHGVTLSALAIASIGGATLGIGYFFLIILLVRAAFGWSSDKHGFFGGR